ncbi:RNA polymerase sigma factor [Pedobacter antarcticus]|uniref:RNA polymerase sigma factor n=1 Tax=Pedobacter antarcticus TaxID=34086 RepID=UPI000884C5F7|nr:sigma-70 family RNA polymerase sigma factor [Pedobacter antarcticus]SDM26612.1 RNA polymerase sigma-70 factor, ECF subfamily [Pedobacter antarcticus]
MVFKGKIKQDEYFLGKAIRGEREGLEYLVDEYQDMAYTIAFKIVRNNEDAEEIVQDSFVKAFRSLSDFKKMAKFSSWLYRIVYNTALTKISGQKPVTCDIYDDLERNEYIDQGNASWNLLLEADRKKYIDLALSKIKDEDRLIITLYYIAEQSVSEITKITNLQTSAVKMRLLRARKQLETELKILLQTETKEL